MNCGHYSRLHYDEDDDDGDVDDDDEAQQVA